MELTSGTFTINSVDLAGINGSGPSPVTITGYRSGSLIDSFTSSDLGSSSYTTFTLGWTGIDQLDFSNNHQQNLLLTNFDVTTGVPEPSTWAMMLLGFTGLGFMAYRRKSKS